MNDLVEPESVTDASEPLPRRVVDALPEPPVWAPDPEIAGLAGDAAPADPLEIDDFATAVDATAAATSRVPYQAKPRRRSGSRPTLLFLAAAIAVGGSAFALGRVTGSSPAATNALSQNGALQGDPGAFGPGASGGPGGVNGGSATVEGTVVSISADHLTVKLANGQTIDVAIGSTTTYHAQASGSQSDVLAGDAVRVKLAAAAVAPGATPTARASGASAGTATDVTVTSR